MNWIFKTTRAKKYAKIFQFATDDVENTVDFFSATVTCITYTWQRSDRHQWILPQPPPSTACRSSRWHGCRQASSPANQNITHGHGLPWTLAITVKTNNRHLVKHYLNQPETCQEEALCNRASGSSLAWTNDRLPQRTICGQGRINHLGAPCHATTGDPALTQLKPW